MPTPFVKRPKPRHVGVFQHAHSSLRRDDRLGILHDISQEAGKARRLDRGQILAETLVQPIPSGYGNDFA